MTRWIVISVVLVLINVLSLYGFAAFPETHSFLGNLVFGISLVMLNSLLIGLMKSSMFRATTREDPK